jgi:UDP-glucuronate decarboxylase
LVKLMERQGSPGGPVNLGNPTELTICELVELVLDLTGSSSKVSYRRLPVDDPRRRKPDISRAIELLDWTPTTSLENGLRKTIAWFDAQRRLAAPAPGLEDRISA